MCNTHRPQGGSTALAVGFSHFQHKVSGPDVIVQQLISNIYLISDRIPERFSNPKSKYLPAIVTRWKGLDVLGVELITSSYFQNI